MNITLAVDEKIAEQARATAHAMGKSLNQLVREYLEQLAGQRTIEAEVEEFRALSGRGNSGGARFDREELYAERLKHNRGA